MCYCAVSLCSSVMLLCFFRLLTKLRTVEKDNLSEGHHFTVAVMNIGAPAGGA